MLGLSFTRPGITLTIMVPYIINRLPQCSCNSIMEALRQSIPCFCMLSVSRSKRRLGYRGDWLCQHHGYWLIFTKCWWYWISHPVSHFQPVIFYSQCGFNYLDSRCLMDDLSLYLSIIEARPFLLFGCCPPVPLTPFGAILHRGNWKLELRYRGTGEGHQLLVLTSVPHLLNIIMKLISHKNIQGRLAR